MGTTSHLATPEDDGVVMTLGTGAWAKVYEAVMVTLALAVVALFAVEDHAWARPANLVIWGVFVVDYTVRLWLSTDRRRFVRRNVPDLVAILPLDFFRAARLARLARLLRLVRSGRVLWRASSTVRDLLATNGLDVVLTAATITISAGAAIVFWFDPAFDDLGDAFWWAIVTSTTVGYGDLAPVSGLGRAVAVVVMVVGIGTIGMLTGAIATYFVRRGDATTSADPEVRFAQQQVSRWDHLSPTERRRVAGLLQALADDEGTA